MIRIKELQSRLRNAGFTPTALECARDGIVNPRGVVTQLPPGTCEEAVEALTAELWESVEEQRVSVCRKRILRFADRIVKKAQLVVAAEDKRASVEIGKCQEQRQWS